MTSSDRRRRAWLPLLRPSSCLRQAQGGFSLEELVMYVLLSGLVLWFTVFVVLSSSRSQATMLRSLRLGERWGRLNMLLETEIGEAMRLEYSTAPPAACGGGSANPSEVVTAVIPSLQASTSLIQTSISYYNRNSDLYRCGPPYDAQGRLRADQPHVESRISSRTRLLIEGGSNPSQDPSRTLRYSVQFLDTQNVSLFQRSAIARARVARLQ